MAWSIGPKEYLKWTVKVEKSGQANYSLREKKKERKKKGLIAYKDEIN